MTSSAAWGIAPGLGFRYGEACCFEVMYEPCCGVCIEAWFLHVVEASERRNRRIPKFSSYLTNWVEWKRKPGEMGCEILRVAFVKVFFLGWRRGLG